MNTAKREWDRLQKLLAAAIDEWGYNDPRTIALEDLEAEACERYLALAGE
jgi:hypothetical protein